MPTKTARQSVTTTAPAAADIPAMLFDVDPALVDPHPRNPRKDLGDLTELIASVRAQGILQPVVLIPHPTEPDRYYALAGHRRTAAALAVGMATIPAVIRTGLTDAAQLELMLLENLQRQDLTVIEEGAGYQGLLDLGVKKTEIAAHTGRAVSTVGQRIKVASLPESLHDAIIGRALTLEEAVQAADLRETAPDLFEAAIDKGVSVTQAMKDALREADKRDRIAALTKEWAENGHELRIGYVTSAGALGLRYGLEMEPGEHAHCPGAVVYVNEWELSAIDRVGRFYCVQPDLHAERIAELKRKAEEDTAAGNRPGETDAQRQKREAAEQLEVDLTVAAEARQAWVVEQFLTPAQGSPDDAAGMRTAALTAFAAKRAFAGGIDGDLYVWGNNVGDQIREAVGSDGPAIMITLALTVLSDVEEAVPQSSWSWNQLTNNSYLRTRQTNVYEYLSLLANIGYPLLLVESDMRTALQGFVNPEPEPEGADQ